MAGRPEKKITDYIRKDISEMNTVEDFSKSPGTIFLSEIVDISDSIAHCIRNFPKKRGTNKWTQASEDSLAQLTAATIGTIMGQFEMYQRLSFATAFEMTRHHDDFDVYDCIHKLTKESGVNIHLSSLFGYRGEPAAIGQLMTENMQGWHDPDRVNTHFKALYNNLNFFATADKKSLVFCGS